MNLRIKSDQQGIAHIVLIILVVVVVVAVAGVGYFVYSKQKKSSDSSTTSASLTKAIQEAAKNCEEEDKEICKFFASWKESKEYRVTSTDTSEGVTTNSVYEYEADGEKSYVKTDGQYSYEVITIGKTTYTKNGDIWWKQTTKPSDTPSATENFDYDFEESTTEEQTQKTVYKFIAKEACGNLTCFKYQVIDPTSTDTTTYILFDDKNYQLRKNITEAKDYKSEQVFEYSNVTINVPSPVQELGPNQYIVPGESEPVSVPTE